MSKRGGSRKSIKWPKVYDALRRKGKTKRFAAAVSNAMWNRKRGRRDRNAG